MHTRTHVRVRIARTRAAHTDNAKSLNKIDDLATQLESHEISIKEMARAKVDHIEARKAPQHCRVIRRFACYSKNG